MTFFIMSMNITFSFSFSYSYSSSDYFAIFSISFTTSILNAILISIAARSFASFTCLQLLQTLREFFHSILEYSDLTLLLLHFEQIFKSRLLLREQTLQSSPLLVTILPDDLLNNCNI